jgi:cytidine deaminase
MKNKPDTGEADHLPQAVRNELISLAISAKEKSYSPYSKLRVGAAVLTASGKIYSGTNIENASYGATVCAERVAIFKAISEGHREDIVGLAVVSDQAQPIPPCGMCRQVLSELPEDVRVIMAGNNGEFIEERMSKLLPYKFYL